jgi:predicted SnoaL-like aldol condensation-catalyzing enzyme
MRTLRLILLLISFLIAVSCNTKPPISALNQCIDSVTAVNKAIAIDFFAAGFIKKDIQGAFDKYVGEKYIQHNPYVIDGRQAPLEYLSSWLRDNPQASCEIKRVIAEKDMVVIHSHWKDSPQVRGQAGVDIFRIENGKIVEHWDVIQDIPEKSANDNSMF